MFFIDIKEFFYFFLDSELKRMNAHVLPIDIEDIKVKVHQTFFSKKMNSNFLLDGMNINEVANTESNSQARYLSPNEKNVMKLSPWIE